MFALIFQALMRRRAPTIALSLLTVLAAGAAAGAPQFIAGAARDLAKADVQSAPVADRVVAIEKDVKPDALGPSVLEQATADVAAAFDIPGLAPVAGIQTNGAPSVRGKTNTTSPLAYRQGMCDQLVLDGRCPAAEGEAALSVQTAATLGLALGQAFGYQAPGNERPATLRVSAIYRPRDPDALYWAGRPLMGVGASGEAPSAAIAAGAAILTTVPTIVAAQAGTTTVTVDLVADDRVFATTAPLDVRDRVSRERRQLDDNGYSSTAGLNNLAVRIYNDRVGLVWGIPITVLQLLVLCWLALYLSVRHGGLERRGDIGLLKLRGLGRLRTLTLAMGQSAVPMLAGGVIALAVAVLLLGPAPGTVDPEVARLADLASVAGAAIAVLGALVAALIAERRNLRAPVALLLRRVPPRASAGRAGTLDLVLVALALAGVYQTRASASGSKSWLALLTPGLLALALGVLVARLLMPVAVAVGRRALLDGQLSIGMTAIYLARRPAIPRLTALLTASVAMLATATAAYDTIDRADHERAATELGADRVLVVDAPSRAQLLAAVRAADPRGQAAMAVVASTRQGVLAVDATRLATVARWRGDYGASDATELAHQLRSAPAAPVTLIGPELALDVTRTDNLAGAVAVRAVLTGPDGGRIETSFGPVRPGRATLRASVPRCTGTAGCQLVSLGVMAEGQPAPAGVDITVHGLTGAEGAGPTTADFADRARWRTAIGGQVVPVVLSTAADGLRIAIGKDTRDPNVYVADTPDRLAAIASGSSVPGIVAGNPQLIAFPGATIPVRVIGTATALPFLGRSGVLIDLDTADRMAGDFGGGESLQVWLTAGAPGDIVARLRERGLTVFSDARQAQLADRYASQAPTAVLRFQLLAALIGILVAAGAIGVVAAVERRTLASELIALRVQGAPRRTVRRVAVGGYAIVVLLSLAGGVLTAVLARTLLAVDVPLFRDGWAGLPPPASVRLLSLGAAVLAAVLVFGVVVGGVAWRLVRQIRSTGGEA